MNESGKMYFAVIEAVPKEGTDAFEKYGGAAVSCWVNTVDPTKARQMAIDLIERSGWRVTNIESEKTVSSDIYSSDHEGRRYFEQAITDGEVCVIYTFPKGQIL